MTSNQAPPIPPHGLSKQWNSDQTNLSAHKLTSEELRQKLQSRQSHNIAIARATLLNAGVQGNQPFTPALAARLRAATEQSLESVISQCNNVVTNSKRIREAAAESASNETLSNDCKDDETSELVNAASQLTLDTEAADQSVGFPASNDVLNEGLVEPALSSTASVASSSEGASSGGNTSGAVTIAQRLAAGSEPAEHPQLSKYKSDIEYTKNIEEARLEHEKELERLKEDCEVESPPVENFEEVIKLSQQPNKNLEKTLELVVSTCQALWAQLQQERETRQQLQEHLQRQGAVIGDLTSELLQIQEQQEDILQEVQLARSSLLWQLSAAAEEPFDSNEVPLLGHLPKRNTNLFDAPEERHLSASAPPSFYSPLGSEAGSSSLQFGGQLFPSLYEAGLQRPLLGRHFQVHSLQASPKHGSFLPSEDAFS